MNPLPILIKAAGKKRVPFWLLTINNKEEVSMKKLSLLTVVVILLASIFLCTAPASAKQIEWKFITGPGRTDGHTAHFALPLMEQLNKGLAGRLKITYAGGPESVPPFAQLTPLRQGVFDMLGTTPSFYAGGLPIAQVGFLLSAPNSELRRVGFNELLDEIHQKKAGAKFVSGFSSKVGSSIFLNKKLGKADLTGLKLRTSSIYDPFVKALGGATVKLPIGEVYGALDKGVVDGALFPALGPLDFKWYEVAKWMTRPLFANSPFNILVNLGSWNALPKDVQNEFMKIVIEMENSKRPELIKLVETETALLVKNGVQIDQLPDAEAAKFLRVCEEASWKGLVLDVDPYYGPKLKALADKLPK